MGDRGYDYQICTFMVMLVDKPTMLIDLHSLNFIAILPDDLCIRPKDLCMRPKSFIANLPVH